MLTSLPFNISLPKSLSLSSSIPPSEYLALAVSFLLGLLIGLLIRKIITVGLIALIITVLLIATGYLSITQVEQFVQSIVTDAPHYLAVLENLRAYIPYNSVSFVVGLVIGLVKG